VTWLVWSQGAATEEAHNPVRNCSLAAEGEPIWLSQLSKVFLAPAG